MAEANLSTGCPVIAAIEDRLIKNYIKNMKLPEDVLQVPPVFLDGEDPKNILCYVVTHSQPEEDVTPYSYCGFCCKDCGEQFPPRKGQFGRDYCYDCVTYFSPLKQRSDVKTAFQSKDITLDAPFRCLWCSHVVHKENELCGKCDIIRRDEYRIEEDEDEDEDRYDMWDDIQSQCPPDGCEFCSKRFSGYDKCVCDDT